MDKLNSESMMLGMVASSLTYGLYKLITLYR